MSLRTLLSTSVVRYLVVGVLSYAIDVGTLVFSSSVLGVPLWIATTAGFWLSFLFNFAVSRHWTFRASGGSSRSQLIRYGMLVAINYVATLGLVAGLHHWGLSIVVAKTCTVALLTVTTYLAYRRWVFAEPMPVG